MHYRRYFASRRKSRFAAKKSRVISHEELCSILATTNVVLPKERHYFIETNYTQYIHAHHKRDLETTRAIIARKCPEYLPAYDLYMSKTHGHHFNMFVMKRSFCSTTAPGCLISCLNWKRVGHDRLHGQ